METKNHFIVSLNRVDTLTLSSVITSSLAVGLALAGYLLLATALLYLAMLADAMDGILARKLGIESDFGCYLDGFMDVLIYLTSPALIFYLSGFNGWMSAFLVLMIACGCIRLSVFNQIGNIQESGSLSYLGMPVFWSVFILGIYQVISLVSVLAANVLLVPTLGIFSAAMLLNRPFFKFKSLKQIFIITLGGATGFMLLEALL